MSMSSSCSLPLFLGTWMHVANSLHTSILTTSLSPPLSKHDLAGLDLSTQSFTALVTDETGAVVHRSSVNFDEELPEYGTSSGMHRVAEADGVERVTSPVCMWLQAFDMVLTRIGDVGLLPHVVAVSASAQQHGSVYWKRGAGQQMHEAMKTAGRALQLKDALKGCFACDDCPIWADSSTQEECDAAEKALGGAEALAALTGSRAYPRFTGQQIARMARRHPDVWEACERVSLVSSFVSSVLIGEYAPIDTSDGSGMNLMDIRSRRWSDEACKHAAPDLRDKLGPEPVEPWTRLGTVCGYLQQRYMMASTCEVVCSSGDNPNALVGLRLAPGDVTVSLGTSDTLMGVLEHPSPKPDGHVMCHAGEPGTFFAMLVYKNADVVRKHVRDACCGADWGTLSQQLAETAPGNDGCLVLAVLAEEITPQIRSLGFHREDASGHRSCTSSCCEHGAADVRGVVEGRFLSMACRAAALGIRMPPRRVLVTGGASGNAHVCQVLADVLRAPVLADANAGSDSAALGAALRARAAVRPAQGSGEDRSAATVIATPREEASVLYERLLPRFAAFEQSLVTRGEEQAGTGA